MNQTAAKTIAAPSMKQATATVASSRYSKLVFFILVSIFTTHAIEDFVWWATIKPNPILLAPTASASLACFSHTEGAKPASVTALTPAPITGRAAVGISGNKLFPSSLHFVEVLLTGAKVRQIHLGLVEIIVH